MNQKTLNLDTTIVFEVNEAIWKKNQQSIEKGREQVYDIIIHQGGSRSSKTYNNLIWLINLALGPLANSGWTIDITRQTMAALKGSAMLDFFNILEKMGIYNEDSHNRTDNIYRLNGVIFRFFGSDDHKKVHGWSRHILFINEANDLKKKSYDQLNQRTNILTLVDYNPRDQRHWIYDLAKEPKAFFFKTTFKDNPFITQRIINTILRYKETDRNMWRIYGLGERGVAEAIIYKNWEYVDDGLYDTFEGEELFGLDFGFNHPTALCRVKWNEKEFISDELLYKSELDGPALIRELDKLRDAGKLTRYDIIYADSSRPELIKTLRDADYNVRKTKKGPKSVISGIDFIKKHKHYVTKASINIGNELFSYQWKVDRDDEPSDIEPVKANDDILDAIRYALETKIRRINEIGIA